MMSNTRCAFAFVELLILVVIVAVLAASIIPQFGDSASDEKESTVLYNLRTLRAQIQIYRENHDGRVPGEDMAELLQKTDRHGKPGTGSDCPFGPYLVEIPENPFTNSATVLEITAAPTLANAQTGHGWLYNTTTGEVRICHEDYYRQ